MPNGKSSNLITAQLATSTTTASLVAQNLARIMLQIVNHDVSSNFLVGFDANLNATNGFLVKFGTGLVLDSYTGPVFVKAVSGTPTVSYLEY